MLNSDGHFSQKLKYQEVMKQAQSRHLFPAATDHSMAEVVQHSQPTGYVEHTSPKAADLYTLLSEHDCGFHCKSD